MEDKYKLYEIRDALANLGIRHPFVEWRKIGRRDGYFFTEFGTSEPQFLGSSLIDAFEWMADEASRLGETALLGEFEEKITLLSWLAE